STRSVRLTTSISVRQRVTPQVLSANRICLPARSSPRRTRTSWSIRRWVACAAKRRRASRLAPAAMSWCVRKPFAWCNRAAILWVAYATAFSRERDRLSRDAAEPHRRQRPGDWPRGTPGGGAGGPRYRREQSLVFAVNGKSTDFPLRRWLLAMPALALVTLFIAAPYLTIVVMSVRSPSNV